MNDEQMEAFVLWLQSQISDGIDRAAAAQGDDKVAERNRQQGRVNALVAVMDKLPKGTWSKYAKSVSR
jgi:hypothetical protein